MALDSTEIDYPMYFIANHASLTEQIRKTTANCTYVASVFETISKAYERYAGTLGKIIQKFDGIISPSDEGAVLPGLKDSVTQAKAAADAFAAGISAVASTLASEAQKNTAALPKSDSSISSLRNAIASTMRDLEKTIQTQVNQEKKDAKGKNPTKKQEAYAQYLAKVKTLNDQFEKNMAELRTAITTVGGIDWNVAALLRSKTTEFCLEISKLGTELKSISSHIYHLNPPEARHN